MRQAVVGPLHEVLEPVIGVDRQGVGPAEAFTLGADVHRGGSRSGRGVGRTLAPVGRRGFLGGRPGLPRAGLAGGAWPQHSAGDQRAGGGHDSAVAALTDLLQLGGFDFTDPDSASFELAETIGLFCFSSIAGLNEMNDFDRPVVINLNNQWFTLIELDRGSASLKVDNTIHSVPVAELLDACSGNFTLLWRAPPGYKAPSSIGDRGPAVDWLVNRLQVINDRTGPTTPGYVFDGELEVQVKQFQLTTGLTPDGIAGVKTWIKINDADDIETPRLDGESL